VPQLGLQTGVTAPSISTGSAVNYPITPLSNNTVFTTAVALWFSNNASAIQTYGHIRYWDTSAVTVMSNAFKGRNTFNEDISGWDVSNVTNMWAMFYEASVFNQDIGGWDVSNVTKMNQMFQRATAFDQDISGWDVSNVTTMNRMFQGLSNAIGTFDQDISGWTLNPSLTRIDWDIDTNPNWTAAEKP
jgi:surface protein